MTPSLTPRKLALFAFLFLVGLYTLFQARFLILGPEITITTPQSGTELASQVVLLEGTATHIAYLTLNDRPIYTDTKGTWKEKLIAPKGYSIMTLRAKDRFGRLTEKQLELVFN